MLERNWFCGDNMVLFNEYYYTQMFYDTYTDCIYIVTLNANDNIVIERLTQESGNYEYYKSIYKNYVNK